MEMFFLRKPHLCDTLQRYQDMPSIAQCTQLLINPINFRILLTCLNLNMCLSIVLNWDPGALLL